MSDDIRYLTWNPPAHIAEIIRSFSSAADFPPISPSPAKVGTSKAGVNDSRKVECTKSKHHGFHPKDEPCPMCAPPEARAPEHDHTPEWSWLNGELTFR